jgi:acyl-ACP thioesterase
MLPKLFGCINLLILDRLDNDMYDHMNNSVYYLLYA